MIPRRVPLVIQGCTRGEARTTGPHRVSLERSWGALVAPDNAYSARPRAIASAMTPFPPACRADRSELLDSIANLVATQPEQRSGPPLVACAAFQRLNEQLPLKTPEIDAAR